MNSDNKKLILEVRAACSRKIRYSEQADLYPFLSYYCN